MGSYIELNDTLQITTQQGFPDDLLSLARQQQGKINVDAIKGKVFAFKNKPGARLYHTSPTRCFLVHNINGKWLYWGKILVIEQTIAQTKKGPVTSGKYQITQVYDPEYQKQITRHESKSGESYF